MLDAKRIKNLSTKTTSYPLMQSTPYAPAKLQNRYLFDHGPLSKQTLMEPMSYLTFVQR